MNRGTGSTICLMTLALTAAVWGQNASVDPTGTPVVSDVSATTAATLTAADLRQGIEEQLADTFAQFIADEIHNLFGELRTALGLPAEPTDPATDPLAILETVITDMVIDKLTN